MAVFAEYETGDPLSVTKTGDQIRTHWKAKRRGADSNRFYFIKSIAGPAFDAGQGGKGNEGSFSGLAGAFDKSVARQKEGARACPERFAPIFSSGQTENAVWYVTEFYPRRSLADFYSTAADVNDCTLAKVVYSVAHACLALQQATGLSHGNLKTSNVLVEGEPGPLEMAQLRLIDAAGSNADALPRQEEQSRGKTLRDVVEARDLRAIGGIIFKLVENDFVEESYPGAHRIELSYPWRALRGHAQRWFELCNRLLNPNLSLDEISLQTLVDEFKPSPRPKRSRIPLAGVGLLLAVGIASYAVWSTSRLSVVQRWWRAAPRIGPSSETAPSSSESAAQQDEGATRASRVNRASNSGLPPTHPLLDGHLSETPSPNRETVAAPKQETKSEIPSIPADRPTSEPDPSAGIGTTLTAGSSASDSTMRAPDSGTPAPNAGGNANEIGAARGQPAAEQSELLKGSNPAPTSASPRPESPPPEDAGVTRSEQAERPTSVNALSARGRATSPSPSDRGESGSRVLDTNALARSIISRPKSGAGDRGATPQTQRPLFSGEPKSERAKAPASPKKDTNASPRSRELAKAQTSPNSDRAGTETHHRAEPPVPQIAQLDSQLRRLETEVSRAVALPRNSELFSRVDALEAQYIRAQRLSERTKRRFDLLRVNMARKLPGAPPPRTINGPMLEE